MIRSNKTGSSIHFGLLKLGAVKMNQFIAEARIEGGCLELFNIPFSLKT